MAYDDVQNPSHYCDNAIGFEPIEATEHMSLPLGSAFAYLFRCTSKGTYMQDLRKAQWYLMREVTRLQQAGDEWLPDCAAKEVFQALQYRARWPHEQDLSGTVAVDDKHWLLCANILHLCYNGYTARDIQRVHDQLTQFITQAAEEYAAKLAEDLQRINAANRSVGVLPLGTELAIAAVRAVAASAATAVATVSPYEEGADELNVQESEYLWNAMSDMLTECATMCSVLGIDYVRLVQSAVNRSLERGVL